MRGSMYPEIESWKEFYEELDPDRRKALYEAGLKEKEDDGANGLRGEFLELRYTDPRDPKHRVDNFLWQMVILPGFLRPIYFIRALGEREIKGIIRDLGLVGAEDWDEAKRRAAYWEYRNAADRYLSTCTGPNYAKKLFGTMASSDEEKLERTARDLYSMAVTVPEKYGREKELELFTTALKDSFITSSSDAERAWNTVRFMKKK